MQITRLGHSCLHVRDEDASILIDPGSFSNGFTELTGLTAVLITHQHPDHLAIDKLPVVLAANPDAAVYADHGTAAQLRDKGIEVTAVAGGDSFDAGTSVSVHGAEHAIIHPDLATIPNASFLIGGRLLHPGDALHVPDAPVEILALPAAAPWMAIREAIDYQRAVGATTAFPIHDGIVAPAALGIYYGRFAEMGPAGSRWLALGATESTEL